MPPCGCEKIQGLFGLVWNRLRWAVLLGAGLGLLGGCGRGSAELGQLVPVAGRVTFNGQPLTTGQVVFRPDAGRGNSSMHEPRGRINAQGHYVLATAGKKGVPPGWYQVFVIAQEPFDTSRPYLLPKSLIPERYRDPTTSGLAIQAVENPAAGAYDIALEP